MATEFFIHKMSEHMEHTQLQELLTGVFSKLTTIIRTNRFTIQFPIIRTNISSDRSTGLL